MAVVATAGHVDHGKSTLVRLLTGTEPDRWEQERLRGLTIDLGYAWTDLDGVHLSLVDVPGHERFAANMLAGLGPVAGVLFVVAADAGWARQSHEHARSIAALGLGEVLLVVTRCDLVAAGAAREVARGAEAQLAELGVPARETVFVSGRSGAGLDDLRAGLRRLAFAVGEQHPTVPVRLWLDRAFTVRGAGTVVTGTLTAGTLIVEDELVLRGARVRVRGLQSSDATVQQVVGPARVAVNLRGVALDDVGRGDVLLDPRLPAPATVVDVRLHEPWRSGGIPGGSGPSPAQGPGQGPAQSLAQSPTQDLAAGTAPTPPARPLPRQLVLHVGTAAVAVHVHVLPDGTVRLRPEIALPLAVGDRGVLRDPGRHEVLAGIEVLRLDPPRRRTRGRPVTAEPRSEAGSAPGSGAGSGAGSAPGHTGVSRAHDGTAALLDWLGAHPLDPPTREQLDGWGVTVHLLAEAERSGRVTRAGGLVLTGDAVQRAREAVSQLDQPFRPGDLAAALHTSRRVVIPLLERLDTDLVTRRLPDGTRVVRQLPAGAPRP